MFFRNRKRDLKKGLKEFRKTPEAVLVDVRSEDEYDLAHIPDSVNVPLKKLKKIGKQVPDLQTPVFVYCFRGIRADRAARRLAKMGYTDVRSIGGIAGYEGEVERG